MKKVELLAPAGSPEKLEIAIHYGADAVYLGGNDFSLRNFSKNFSIEEMAKGIEFAHSMDARVYVALNVYTRNNEHDKLRNYLHELKDVGPDALIVSDPAVIMAAQEIVPEIELHLSTQANTTNYGTILFWEKLGVTRVNAARELSLAEIREMCEATSIEVETFIHGAMCMSYSGRCLLSAFLANRDANQGACAHPCRWQYSVVEEMRPDEYIPLMEDSRGTYLFNSKDLCMIEHLPELIQAGIVSLKIEGRMKGINYLATAVKAYREAIDSYYDDAENYVVKNEWLDGLQNVKNRGFCTGFYFGAPSETEPNYKTDMMILEHLFLGRVVDTKADCLVTINVRNKIFKGESIEVLTPIGLPQSEIVLDIVNEKGESVDFAQPNSRVDLVLGTHYSNNDIIRRKLDSANKVSK